MLILRRVAPLTSPRTAARYSSGVGPLPGSMLFGLPSWTQPPRSGSTPYMVPPTTSSLDPTFPGRLGASWVTDRSRSCQRMVAPAQALFSWVIRTTAVPERSPEAAVTAAALRTAAAALATPGPPIGDATARTAAVAA